MKLYRIIGAEGRVTIPFVLRQIIGFSPSDVVSFEITGENTIRVCREQLVGRDVPRQPISKVPELLEYSRTLSCTELYDLIVHLSFLWANHQEKPPEKEGTP